MLVNRCVDNPTVEESQAENLPLNAQPQSQMKDGDSEDTDATASIDRGTDKGSILLLDDDPDLSGVLSAFLAENGYQVVTVQNGGEGIREVLAGDFILVLSDFMMPGLPGDLFYQAVERIRPDLCRRFVFMTGHREDAKTNAFVKRVDALVLWKPFPMKAVLDAITLVEVRCGFPAVFASGADTPEAVKQPSPDEELLTAALPTEDIDGKVAGILARARCIPAPVVLDETVPPVEKNPVAPGIGKFAVIAGAALLVLMAGGAWKRMADAQKRVDAVSEEKRALDEEWEILSPKLEHARVSRAKTEADQKRLERMVGDRAGTRWTPMLRALIPPSTEAGFEILSMQARGTGKDQAGFEVRVRGAAAGVQSRALTNRFRENLEQALRSAGGGAVTSRFEHFEEEPGASPEARRTVFGIVAIKEASPAVPTMEEIK